MKRSHLIGALGAMLTIFVSLPANAALVSRLGGAAAYDTVLDITWVTNASLSGADTWDNQVTWAANLNYLGFDDWRLASMSVATGVPTGTTTSVVDCSTATEQACRDSELGYMYYYNMGGNPGDIKTGDQTVDGVLLTKIVTGYWSGTAFDSINTWLTAFNNGHQFTMDKTFVSFGWAVRTGDVSAVPVPAAVWLFGSGLIGLVGMGRRKKA